MNPTFEQMEDGIIQALRLGVPELKSIETYAGQLDGDELGRLPVRFPAAFVVYGGSEYEPVDGPTFGEEAAFTVVLCASDARGRHEGAYALVTAALDALVGRIPAEGAGRLRPRRTSLMYTNRQVTAYAVEFTAWADQAFTF